MNKLLALTALALATLVTPAFAQNGKITCVGMLIDVDMVRGADFPMAVIYDNLDTLNTHTCVLDVGRAGHWPLRGQCDEGRYCKLTGSYYKKIGDTYYMRSWDSVEYTLEERDHDNP